MAQVALHMTRTGRHPEGLQGCLFGCCPTPLNRDLHDHDLSRTFAVHLEPWYPKIS